jgi:hypothetical protein
MDNSTSFWGDSFINNSNNNIVLLMEVYKDRKEKDRGGL